MAPRAAVLACVWLAAAVTLAQAPPNPATKPAFDRGAVERVALGKARTALLARVQTLPLRGDLTVGAWCAGDVARDRALRKWVRSLPRFGMARIYGDGSGDVDMRLAPDALLKQLTTMIDIGKPTEPPVTASDLQSAAKSWKTLWSSGSAEAAVMKEDRRPDGWEDVKPEGVQLARLAATSDALLALLDEAAKLKVTAARRLHEFVDASPEIRAAVAEKVREAAKVKVEFGPDQVAVADATLAMADLIRILTDVHQSLYKGDMFQAPDFREMALTAGMGEVAAQGLAPPPGNQIEKPTYEQIELDQPSWLAQTLTATGRHEPTEQQPVPGETRLALARFDGVDKLRRQVEALKLTGGVTVEQLLAQRPELKDDVIIFLSGARVTQAPTDLAVDAPIEVSLELSLRRLWLIVRRGMQTVEVDPATTQPSASQPASGGEGARGNG